VDLGVSEALGGFHGAWPCIIATNGSTASVKPKK
jgi:hypothetical protein